MRDVREKRAKIQETSPLEAADGVIDSPLMFHNRISESAKPADTMVASGDRAKECKLQVVQ